ncbi:alcohol dehydrogenase [Boletus coccyginus]|nr:alcohol dehydrogenase [Boletus coccyginus]
MAPITNKRIIFKEFPTGLPVPGQTTTLDASQTIDLDNVPLNGGALVKTLVLSLEPYVLARMRPSMPNKYQIGETINNYGIGVVVRSENPAFQVGDHLHGYFLFQEYSVLHDFKAFTKIHNEYNLPWSVFVGIAGLPGQTAYFGWKEHSRAKKGEVAFVTSGAGAVGSFVIQLAKQDGMKVIASAGSDDKVQFLKELGADVAFNYKTTKTSEILEKEGPIDVYWDNVGGESLEAALNAAAKHARFIECGMIAGYGGSAKPIPNLVNIIPKEISINGFVATTLSPKYLEIFEREVPAQITSKELTYREDITRGLENAEVAFDNFLKGAFIGKSVVIVADE